MKPAILKYALCDFDDGQVKDDNGSLEWHEDTLERAKTKVQANPGKCALFLPKDVPGLGHPLYPEVTRKDFEEEPGVYGVCFYKSWSGYAFE